SVQLPPAARCAPERLIAPDPGVAVGVPPQELFTPFGVATTMPAGSESEKPMLLSAEPLFGFVSVNVRVLVPFKATELGENALLIRGGATTVMFAVAGRLVPASIDVAIEELIQEPA